MTLFVEIVYVLVTVILILVVLLQSGRGGGMGTALGGGASQSVFGGSGGADFLARLTQGLAALFMLCAVYLAYASGHTGSDLLKEASQDMRPDVVGEDEPINWEFFGPNPLPLTGEKPATPSLEPTEVPADEAPPPTDEEVADPAPEAVEGEPPAEPAADDEPAEPEPSADEPSPEPGAP